MSYIPAEVFKDPATGIMVLEVIDAITHIVPRQDPSSMISSSNRARLSAYNRRSLNKILNENNLEDEIKKLEKSKELFSEIAKVKNEYGKFSQNSNLIFNRFSNMKEKIIRGVGVDGSGYFPINYTQERVAYAMIEDGADKYDAWPSYTGDEEDILKASCGNLVFWQASNMAQLPIGTPVEIVSAVIELTSPRKLGISDIKFETSLTGEELIRRRIECNNLKYLLEGNKLDLDDKSFKGINIFKNTNFRGFFRRDKQMKIKYNVHGVGAGGDNIIEAQQKKVEDSKFINDNVSQELKDLFDETKNLYNSNGVDAVRAKNTAIMFIYMIFFLYGAYIYNMYDSLIEQVKRKNNKILEDEYNKARLNMIRNYLKLINCAIVKFFGLDVEPTEELIYASSKETTETGDDNNALEYKKLQSVLQSIKPDDIKDNFVVGFLKNKNYKLIGNGKYRKEAFSKDNYPIVFEKDYATGSTSVLEINYRETVERLVRFLTLGGEIPVVKGETVPVGAPMQNDEILEATSGALAGYYQEVSESKSIYINYMDLKINIFMAGLSSRDVVDLRDHLMNQFGLIGTTMSTQQQKDVACIKLVAQVMEQYKKLRKEEMRLTDDKTIIAYGRRRELGDKLEDYPRQVYRALKMVKAGTEAVVRLEVAKLTYALYQQRNPRTPMCGNFLPLLVEKAAKIDEGMNQELSRMMEKKMVDLERRYGSNAVKTIVKDMRLINLQSIPKPPENYMKTIGAMFASVGAKIPGMPVGTPMMGIPGGPASGPGGPIAKKVLPLEQRLRIEQAKFWQDLRTAFNGKTILIPVARLKTGSIFDDGEFYMIDIFRSLMFNRIDAVRLTTGGKITPQVIFGRVQQRGYIMMTSQTQELGNPNQWRALNHNNVVKMLVRDEGVIKFKNIRKARGVFFNLIANGSFLVDSANISIPEASNVSLGLVRYCSNIVRKELTKCNILISRQQFGQTVQGRVDMLSGTKGIDMISGISYVDFSPVSGIGNDDIVKR